MVSEPGRTHWKMYLDRAEGLSRICSNLLGLPQLTAHEELGLPEHREEGFDLINHADGTIVESYNLEFPNSCGAGRSRHLLLKFRQGIVTAYCLRRYQGQNPADARTEPPCSWASAESLPFLIEDTPRLLRTVSDRASTFRVQWNKIGDNQH